MPGDRVTPIPTTFATAPTKVLGPLLSLVPTALGYLDRPEFQHLQIFQKGNYRGYEWLLIFPALVSPVLGYCATQKHWY